MVIGMLLLYLQLSIQRITDYHILWGSMYKRRLVYGITRGVLSILCVLIYMMSLTTVDPYPYTIFTYLYNSTILSVNLLPTLSLSLSDYHNLIIVFIFATAALILFVAVIINMDMRKRVEKLLYFDTLTGLYNRAGFEKKARKILNVASARRFFVVDFDINKFEHFNSVRGYDEGDKLLIKCARAITLYKDNYEIGARLEADHFVILAENLSMSNLVDNLKVFSDAICNARPLEALLLTFGICEINNPNLSLALYIDRALVAKRTLKGNRDNNIAIYDESFHQQEIETTKSTARLIDAINKREFIPYYQPKVSFITGEVTGYEALVRWVQKDGSVLGANAFVPLCEKIGVIGTLDLMIFEQVCDDILNQIFSGGVPKTVSINFSRVALLDNQFVSKLTNICKERGIDTGNIEIEFTETIFFGDKEMMENAISKLHYAGFTVAIDDFGSGYSSLNMLKDSNFDVVKLDKEFLSVTSASAKSKAIIRSVIALAKDLGLRTVAEGIETQEQFGFLRECGCDDGQGYYFAKPMTKEDTGKYTQEMAVKAQQRLVDVEKLSINDVDINLQKDMRIRSSIIKDKERFKTVFNLVSLGLSIWSIELNNVYELNDATCRILGRSAEELLNSQWRSFVYADDIPLIANSYENLKSGQIERAEYNARFYKPNGQIVYAEVTDMSFGYSDDGDKLLLLAINDITEKTLQEQEQRDMRERYKAIEKAIDEVIFDLDVASDTLTFLKRRDNKEIVIKDYLQYIRKSTYMYPEDVDEWKAKLQMCIDTIGGVSGRYECRNKYFGDEYIWCKCVYSPVCDSRGQVKHIIGKIESIHEEKEFLLNLKQEVNLDPLTRLYNKRYVKEKVSEILAQDGKDSNMCMMMDLDDFHSINAQYGHVAGDEVIKKFSSIMVSLSKTSDIVARVGGDEFLIFMPNSSEEDAKLLAQAIIKRAGKFAVKGIGIVTVGVSIGIASHNRESLTYETLVSRADSAMYFAKNHGKNRCKVYTRENMSKHVFGTDRRT